MHIFTITLLLASAAASSYAASSTISAVARPTDVPPISNNRTLNIVNNCSFPLYPGLLSTNGTAPYTSGFLLPAKTSQELWVSHDWVGRIWGRTNCTFAPANSTSNVTNVIDYNVGNDSVVGGCLTGDCGPSLQCHLSGISPCTLAEFTVTGYMDQTYYDISLVDGYNLDMKISPRAGDVSDEVMRNNSPVCVASTWLSSQDQDVLTKNTLNESYDFFNIERWCPPQNLIFSYSQGQYVYPKLRQSVFPYPDDHDESKRGGWTPCKSACAYTNSDEDCCKGKHNTAKTCGPNGYSKRAKQVCGDAYSYAYDDYTSTFAIPTGPSFDITFCPGGASTNILKAKLGVSAAPRMGVFGFGLVLTIGCMIFSIFG